MSNKWLIFRHQVNFLYVAILKVNRYLGHKDNQLSHISKLVSNGNITKMIPFLDVFGDINLVAIWSNPKFSIKAFGLCGIWSRDHSDLYLERHSQMVHVTVNSVCLNMKCFLPLKMFFSVVRFVKVQTTDL